MSNRQTITDTTDFRVSRGSVRRVSWVAGGLRRAAALSLVEPEIRGLGSLVAPGDVCFDIGAAYGMYSYPLAALVGPRGQVHSFEPQLKPNSLLRAGRASAGAGQIVLTRAGVGRDQGRLDIVVPTKFGFPIHGHAHLRDGLREGSTGDSWMSGVREVRVPVTTVDSICAERGIDRVHFMKIDVEGFEPGVIEGAAKVIERDQPSMLLEIEDRHLCRYGTTAAEFSERLRGLGYSMYTWSGTQWTSAAEVTVGVRNYLFATDQAWDRGSARLVAAASR